jgi:hypothetical protein
VVSPKELTLTTDAVEFTYNGKVQQPTFAVTGVVEGDDVKVSTSVETSINVGSNYTVTASLSGEDSANYVFDSASTVGYKIAARKGTFMVFTRRS